MNADQRKALLLGVSWPRADNRAVLRPYSKDMERLDRKGIRRTQRPSGHHIKPPSSGVRAAGFIPAVRLTPGPRLLTPDS